MPNTLIDPLLGPFFDEDGNEFIPAGFEESLEPLGLAMGEYVVRSTIPDLNGVAISVGCEEMTAFIQEDWNRVMAGNSPRGFLLASRAGSYAAGRIAEEVILRKLLNGSVLFDSMVREFLYFWEACDLGLAVRPKGLRSDDLIIKLQDGRLIALESKAVYRATPYLRRSIPKINKQLKATLASNPNISLVMAALIDLTRHEIALGCGERELFLREGLQLIELL